MKTTLNSNDKAEESFRRNALFDNNSSEQEADRISDGFKNSSDVKSEMSSRLGIDFSGVAIHNDESADRQARSMGAAAFTRGNDVYMGNADTLSQTGASQSQVLAHELAHTVQQGVASESGNAISQSAPTGAVQMWGFHRKKKKTASTKVASTKAPQNLSGFVAPLHNEFQTYIGDGSLAEASDQVPLSQLSTEQHRSRAMVKLKMRLALTGTMKRVNDIIAQESSDIVHDIFESMGKSAGIIKNNRTMKKIQKLGTRDLVSDKTVMKQVQTAASNSMSLLEQMMDNKDVQSGMQVQDQALMGLNGGVGEVMSNRNNRAASHINGMMIRTGGNAFLDEARKEFHGETNGVINPVKQGEQEAPEVMAATRIVGVSNSVLNKLLVHMTGMSSTPGFDPENIQDPFLSTIRDNITASLADKGGDNGKKIADFSLNDIIKRYGKIFAKAVTISAGRTANSDPNYAPPPAPAPVAAPAPAPAPIPQDVAADLYSRYGFVPSAQTYHDVMSNPMMGAPDSHAAEVQQELAEAAASQQKKKKPFFSNLFSRKK